MIALSRLRICLIDDDRMIREAAAMGLRDRGYEVLTAEDGAAGIELVRHEQPDLIITDVVMPEADGFEVLPRVRAEFPDLPVIVATGGGQNGTRLYLNMAAKFGADACLAKPFSVDELAETVERVWARVTERRRQLSA
jgi:DNA-binding response OmpR family regulator